MAEETAPVGGAEAISVTVPAPANDAPLSVDTALTEMRKFRKEQNKPAEPAAPEVAAAEPPKELAEKPDGAPETEPAEPAKEDDPAPEPTVDPPRSWPKDKKEAFKLLPPDLQREVAELERSREVEVRRGQNEVADARKAAEAERVRAEQQRQQYETALPALLQTLQSAQAGEFADIKTQEDVTKLANEDWPRFARWQAHQMQVARVEQEVKEAQTRQASEFEGKWSDFIAKQNQLLTDKAPELADKETAVKLRDKAVSVLNDVGFSNQELAELAAGKSSLAVHDHRLQLLILDAVKFREAKANAAKAPPKPVPPVQRPGAAPDKGAQQRATIESLKNNLSTAKGHNSVEAAARLYRATRAAR